MIAAKACAPQGALTIAEMCAATGVSRASYYRHWKATAPRTEETALRDELHQLALAERFYGSRRLAAALRRRGWVVNRKRVQRLMRTDNLLCLRERAFVPPTMDARHGWRVVPNLARGMTLTALDQLWVADITYIRLRDEFAFLAVVLDAFSRRVVGWALDVHLQASLALAALSMALDTRRPRPDTLIHHSDRGVQYACADYAARLIEHGIQPSMSRIGSPYDNAKAERFMKTLKQEEVDGRAYPSADEARASIGAFIEDVYNRQRLHSALGLCAARGVRDPGRRGGISRSRPSCTSMRSSPVSVSHFTGPLHFSLSPGPDAGLELDRGEIRQGGVQALAVVHLLDERADGATRLVGITVAASVDLFLFERLHEALGFRVVVRGPDPTHARLDPVFDKPRGVLAAGVLHPAIGMVNEHARPRPTGVERHAERGQCQACLQVPVEGPADDPTTERVEDDGQEREFFQQPDVGDVRDPQLIKSRHLKTAREIWNDAPSVP